MSFTLRDIKGAVIKKREIPVTLPKWENSKAVPIRSSGFNEAIDAQSSVKLRFRELTEQEEDHIIEIANKSRAEYRKQCEEGWPNPMIKEDRWVLRAIYKSIIAAEKEIVEVCND